MLVLVLRLRQLRKGVLFALAEGSACLAADVLGCHIRKAGGAWRGRTGAAENSAREQSALQSISTLPRPFLSFLTPGMFRRRTVYIFLSLLAAVLVGTVVVLSSISYYLSINTNAYISELELDAPINASLPWNATEHGQVELIPRILHQTWKSETLPEKWVDVSQGCRDMMPD